MSGFENRYAFADRLLHRLAFASWSAQVAVADVEDGLYAKALEGVGLDRPVFVAGLPRSGTTMVLELLDRSGVFATHGYRDMPFLLTPLLWRRLSARHQRPDAPRERAHGDGVMISADSPEAFEEVVWRTFWKKHYLPDRIRPWSADERDEDFEAFFPRHLRKVIAVRRDEGRAPARYASKNNLNIARLPLIRRLLPDAVLVVPFRDPLQHAASLLRQHLNFLKMHAEDSFARDYMAAIGHYDFGANLKPVDFGGWLDGATAAPTTLGFWLDYWSAAYGSLLGQADAGINFVGFDALCADPERGLAAVAAVLDVDAAVLSGAAEVRPPRPHAAEEAPADALERARDVHRRLEALSATGPAR